MIATIRILTAIAVILALGCAALAIAWKREHDAAVYWQMVAGPDIGSPEYFQGS